MKLTTTRLIVLLCSVTILSSCSDDDNDLIVNNPIPIAAGETIQIGSLSLINSSGTYLLENGAQLLSTSCNGSVAVSIEYAPGDVQVNTCQSVSGSSNQTNPVSGIESVYFEIGQNSSAEVSLQ